MLFFLKLSTVFNCTSPISLTLQWLLTQTSVLLQKGNSMIPTPRSWVVAASTNSTQMLKDTHQQLHNSKLIRQRSSQGERYLKTKLNFNSKRHVQIITPWQCLEETTRFLNRALSEQLNYQHLDWMGELLLSQKEKYPPPLVCQ